MSRSKRVAKLHKAQARAAKLIRREWEREAAKSEKRRVRTVRLAKSARPDPFDSYLSKRAASGDSGAKELLRKRAFDGSYAYREYLERVVESATSGEVRSGAAAELARLAGDGPAVPEAKWRWSAW